MSSEAGFCASRKAEPIGTLYSNSAKRSLKWRYSCSCSQFASVDTIPNAVRYAFWQNSSRLCACWTGANGFRLQPWGSLCSSVWRLVYVDGQLGRGTRTLSGSIYSTEKNWKMFLNGGLCSGWIQKGHLCEPHFISGPGRWRAFDRQPELKGLSGVGLPRLIAREPHCRRVAKQGKTLKLAFQFCV